MHVDPEVAHRVKKNLHITYPSPLLWVLCAGDMSTGTQADPARWKFWLENYGASPLSGCSSLVPAAAQHEPPTACTASEVLYRFLVSLIAKGVSGRQYDKTGNVWQSLSSASTLACRLILCASMGSRFGISWTLDIPTVSPCRP
jgi:hypothetical protein